MAKHQGPRTCTLLVMGEGPTEPNSVDGRNRRRLTVPEAATVLGVTVDAVRGRIRRGKLQSEHEGNTVYVWVDAEKEDRRGPSEASQGPSPTVEKPSHDQSRLVETLEDQVEYLREQLGEEREARRRADMLLARLAEANASMAGQIRELTAPEKPLDSPETGVEASEGASPRSDTAGAQEGAEEPEEEEGTARRPWWVRWFGG